MGIYKSFDPLRNKWKWEGCGFTRTYDTEEECDADKANVWALHMKNLKTRRAVCDLLVKWR